MTDTRRCWECAHSSANPQLLDVAPHRFTAKVRAEYTISCYRFRDCVTRPLLSCPAWEDRNDVDISKHYLD